MESMSALRVVLKLPANRVGKYRELLIQLILPREGDKGLMLVRYHELTCRVKRRLNRERGNPGKGRRKLEGNEAGGLEIQD